MSNPNDLTIGGQVRHIETGEVASVTYEEGAYGPELVICGSGIFVTQSSPDFENWYPADHPLFTRFQDLYRKR